MNPFSHLTPADKLMIKTILVITAIGLIMILSSCSPQRNITAWRCVNQYKVINGIGHDFISLSGKYGKTIDFDSTICNVGDTIMIKDYKRFSLLDK